MQLSDEGRADAPERHGQAGDLQSMVIEQFDGLQAGRTGNGPGDTDSNATTSEIFARQRNGPSRLVSPVVRHWAGLRQPKASIRAARFSARGGGRRSHRNRRSTRRHGCRRRTGSP